MTALLAALLLAFAELAAPADPGSALAAGNRHFEREEIEAALKAYAGGYEGGGSPAEGVLAYNAGTCALRLGHLPEALLWYRRAEDEMPGDAWLRDNLALTRRALGDPPAEDLVWRIWRQNRRWIEAAGVALAWIAFALLVLTPRFPRGFLAVLALLSFGAFAAGTLLDRFGPRPAVLLAACPARGGLPAGSEIWVRPAGNGSWRVLHGPVCPAEAVGLVRP